MPERLILLECLVPRAGFVIVPGMKPSTRRIDHDFLQEDFRIVNLKIVLPAIAAEVKRAVFVIGADRNRDEVHKRKVAVVFRIIDKPHTGCKDWISSAGCTSQIVAVDVCIIEAAEGDNSLYGDGVTEKLEAGDPNITVEVAVRHVASDRIIEFCCESRNRNTPLECSYQSATIPSRRPNIPAPGKE